jgi:L-amino acid N-acyltransferase YncA
MNYRIRRMTYQDLETVLLMRNDEAVRENSLSPSLIAMDEHQSWFLANKGVKLVLEINDQVLGAVTFSEPDGDTIDWSIYRDQKYSGYYVGLILGTLSLSEFAQFYRPSDCVPKIRAKIKHGNESSFNFHERLGFVFKKSEHSYSIWEKFL